MPSWAKYSIVGGCVVMAILFTKPRPNAPDLKPTPNSSLVLLGVPSKSKANRATFEKIQSGMAFVEVCFVVGSQPNYYHEERCFPFAWSRTDSAVWHTEEGSLLVQIDETGLVTSVEIRDGELPLADR